MEFPIKRTYYTAIETILVGSGVTKIGPLLQRKALLNYLGVLIFTIPLAFFPIFVSFDDPLDRIGQYLVTVVLIIIILVVLGFWIYQVERQREKEKMIEINTNNRTIKIYNSTFGFDSSKIDATFYQSRFGYVSKIVFIRKQDNSNFVRLDHHILNPVLIEKLIELTPIPLHSTTTHDIPPDALLTEYHKDVRICQEGETWIFDLKQEWLSTILYSIGNILPFLAIAFVLYYIFFTTVLFGNFIENVIQIGFLSIFLLGPLFLFPLHQHLVTPKIYEKSLMVQAQARIIIVGSEAKKIQKDARLVIHHFKHHGRRYRDCIIQDEQGSIHLPFYASSAITDKLIEFVKNVLNLGTISNTTEMYPKC